LGNAEKMPFEKGGFIKIKIVNNIKMKPVTELVAYSELYFMLKGVGYIFLIYILQKKYILDKNKRHFTKFLKKFFKKEGFFIKCSNI
jgi:Leu/Phe-tRNA-protein transferase